MEKVTEMVEHENIIVVILKEIWIDLSSSWKHGISELLIQISSSIAGVYFLFMQHKVEYKQYISISESFLHNIVPTIIGSAIYSYMMYNRDPKGPSKFITFLVSISLSAFSTDFFIQMFNQTPSPFYYLVGGAIILPVFQGVISLAVMVKRDGPKAIFDWIKSKLNNTKKDETI